MSMKRRNVAAIYAFSLLFAAFLALLYVVGFGLHVPDAQAQDPDGKTPVPGLVSDSLMMMHVTGIAEIPMIVVPDLSGSTLEEAKSELGAKELGLGRIIEQESRRASGTIIDQNPAPRKMVFRGTAVSVTIAVKPNIPGEQESQLIRVPEVVGLSLESAEATVHRKNLVLVRRGIMQTGSVAGIVLTQSPEPGKAVMPGSIVAVTISAYPFQSVNPDDGKVTVPELKGMTLEAARRKLKGEKLVLNRVLRQESTVVEGTVINQKPQPGMRVLPESPVSVTLAKRALVRVPDLRNMPVDTAYYRLEASDLQAGVVSKVPAAGEPGIVISHLPGAGELVGYGSKIDLVVSQADIRHVPSVVGMHIGEARNVIELDGFVVGKISHDSGDDKNVVVSQHPLPDTRAMAGTSVDIDLESPDTSAVAPNETKTRPPRNTTNGTVWSPDDVLLWGGVAITLFAAGMLLASRIKRRRSHGGRPEHFRFTMHPDFGDQEILVTGGESPMREHSLSISLKQDAGDQSVTIDHWKT